MEMRQRFMAEYRLEAVRLLQATGKPAVVVARELGIPRNRLYKWAQDAGDKGEQAFCDSGQPKAGASAGELAVLKRKNARLQQENEILKKQRRTSRENCREVRLDPDAGNTRCRCCAGRSEKSGVAQPGPFPVTPFPDPFSA